eukprot:SAG25_NODE_1607_length_2689_cov_9.438610_1_plen_82_part_00
MLRDSLGGSQDDDDDDDADFVSTAQIETFFTGSKALHVEAAWGRTGGWDGWSGAGRPDMAGGRCFTRVRSGIYEGSTAMRV